MLQLERAEWGARAFTDQEMRQQVVSARSVMAAIFDADRLIGFAVAGPGWSRARATLFNVLIDPDHRGRGLVWPMLAELERPLIERGYGELVMDARIANGFADAVERRYRGRARILAPDHPSPYGPQRTIAVSLRAARVAPKASRSSLWRAHQRSSAPARRPSRTSHEARDEEGASASRAACPWDRGSARTSAPPHMRSPVPTRRPRRRAEARGIHRRALAIARRHPFHR